MFNTGISNNGIIVINKGDTFATKLFINVGGVASTESYSLSPLDKVYFAICEPNQEFENGVVRKMFTPTVDEDGELEIEIKLNPSDTENLLPGTYYYEIKLKIVASESNEDDVVITTIVPKRKLVIC